MFEFVDAWNPGQDFPVVLLFIMLYKVVLNFESLNDYSNESHWAEL